MKIKVNGLTVNINSPLPETLKEKTPIIFLHGFTGYADDWEFVIQNLDERYFPIAVDLPGHGNCEISDNIEAYTECAILNIIQSVIDEFSISKVVLLGYSMGGRVSLCYASQYPSKIKGMILESSTAGIENIDERKERLQNDFKLAERIDNIGIEDFTKQWLDQPLFESLKSISIEEYQKFISKKLTNNAKGLANSLRGFSTGKMASMWGKLYALNFPVLIITGSIDKKYEQIASKMEKSIPHSEHKIVDDTGHNVHLEKPKEFIKLVNNFLEKL